MITSAQLLTLTQWLSPSYPVGAFSYSHGLEWEVDRDVISDAKDFQQWLSDILQHGTGRSDAILLSHAYRAERDTLKGLDQLARAFAGARERLLETEAQGAAFCRVTTAIWGSDLPQLTYPVALGYAAAQQGLPLQPSLQLYLHGFASNLCAAAMRLVPLGQTDGQKVLAQLAPLCLATAEEAETAPLQALSNTCIAAEIAAMNHETQYTRLFRS